VGTTTIGTAVFDNNSGGSVDRQYGALSARPFGAAASQHSGTFIAEAAATVAFDGGSQTLNAGTVLNGAGAYRLQNGTVLVDFGGPSRSRSSSCIPGPSTSGGR
jgi:hypothetical protein